MSGPLPVVHAGKALIRNPFPGQPARIDISAHSRPGDAAWIRVEIADRGIGIRPADQPHVFGSFHRATTHTAYTGAGLGLAICQRVITRHGGAIGVTDNPGGGTCIHFSLPITSPAAIEPTLATPATWTTPPADATSSGARGHGAEMRPPFLFGRLHYGLVAAPRTTKLATRPANTHDVPGRLGASRSAGRPAPQSGYR